MEEKIKTARETKDNTVKEKSYESRAAAYTKSLSLAHRVSAVNNVSAQPTWGCSGVSLQLPENLHEWDILPQARKSTRRAVNLKQLLFYSFILQNLALKCRLNLRHFLISIPSFVSISSMKVQYSFINF